MTTPNEWCVTVFKCSPASVKKVLVELYRFTDDLKGVRSLHFLIRDRIEDEVVFSFRIKVEPKFKEIIKSKLAYKLDTLLSKDKYVIDPTAENSLGQYCGMVLDRDLNAAHNILKRCTVGHTEIEACRVVSEGVTLKQEARTF